MKEKILIVEDEKDLARLLQYNLEKEGYQVVSANDGENGLSLFQKKKPDFVILDLMLPKVSGLDILKTIRQTSEVPVLILTAKKEEIDRVLGLELGADDYVTKPFSVREILARVKSILKRISPQKATNNLTRAGTLEIDVARYEVRLDGSPVALSSKEFEFLKQLIEVDGKVLSRDQLLENIWGIDRSMDIDTRTVDQHIARLRSKLGVEAERILTVKNKGYRIKLD